MSNEPPADSALQRAVKQITEAWSRSTLFSSANAGWALTGLCAVAASVATVPPPSGILGAGLAIVMTAIAATDARLFIIPDKLALVAFALGIAEAAAVPHESIATSIANALLRAALLMLIFWLFQIAYRRLRGREGIGFGDVKLSAVAGLWLGWTSVAIAIDLAAVSALAVVTVQAIRGRRIDGSKRIPFGLFFAPAIWIAWLTEATMLRELP